MFTLSPPFLKHITMSKILFCILLMGFSQVSIAHTYFFGVTDIQVNKESQRIEVIHQLTAHDIENTIAETQQVHFSPEHPNYDELIQAYIEDHFVLTRDNNVIEMNWIGFEVKRGHLFAYQESTTKNYLTHLVVKNSILVDTYTEQINTVNYKSFTSTETIMGSLTFNQSVRAAIITPGE